MRKTIALTKAFQTGTRVARSNALHSMLEEIAQNRVATSRDIDHDLPRLRAWHRRINSQIPADRESIFLTAALLGLGYDAQLTVGRELAPPGRPARYFSWVSIFDDHDAATVVSTGAPVEELYFPVARLPERNTDDQR